MKKIAALLAGLWLVWSATAFGQAGLDPLPLDRVVMISLRNTDGSRGNEQCGAGMVISQNSQRTLVLTAFHVANSLALPENAGKYLAVEFLGSRGRYVKAMALDGMGLADLDLDYVLLSVDGPGVPTFDPAALALLPRNDDAPHSLRIVGNGNCEPWSVIGVPRSVTSMSWNHMGFEGQVPTGTSGGPAFDDDGALVGMVTESVGEGAYAVPIQLILKNITSHKIEMALTRQVLRQVPTISASAVPARPAKSLSEAIMSADAATLAAYASLGTTAPEVEAALREPRADGSVAADTLFTTLARNADGLPGFKAMLAMGLDPNLVLPARDIEKGKLGDAFEKSLLWYAIDSGAIDAAVMLLDHGAWPNSYRTVERTSFSSRMVFPIPYIFEKVADDAARLKLLRAMIAAGFILPRNPRNLTEYAKVKDSCYFSTCQAPDATYQEGYDKWAGSNDKAAYTEISALDQGSIYRNFRGDACARNQRIVSKLTTQWQKVVNNFPSSFRYMGKKTRALFDFNVEGFVGVFKNRAWFLVRSPNWSYYRRYDKFMLLSVTDSMTRGDLYQYEDQGCGQYNSCYLSTTIAMDGKPGGTLRMTVDNDDEVYYQGQADCSMFPIKNMTLRFGQ